LFTPLLFPEEKERIAMPRLCEASGDAIPQSGGQGDELKTGFDVLRILVTRHGFRQFFQPRTLFLGYRS